MDVINLFQIYMVFFPLLLTNAFAKRTTQTGSKDSVDERVRVLYQELNAMKQEQKREKFIMEKEISQLKDTIEKQERELGRQQEGMKEMKDMLEGLTPRLKPTTEESQLKPIKYMRSTYGCEADEIQLACSDGKTISVTSADYGEYSQPCGEGECCIPNPTDCTELLSANDQADWVALKLTCDNQTDCTYLFQGSTFVQNCTVSGPVSYMNVYYTCLPEDADSAVAFSAYAGNDKQYIEYDILMFNAVITNLGGHYQSHASTFLCPVDGVYVFAVNIMNEPGNFLWAHLKKETTQISGLRSELIENKRVESSTVVVSECTAGEKVWVQAQSNATMHGGSSRNTVFTGFLLQRYT